MARQTYDALVADHHADAEALSTLASGQNPDGTPYTLPSSDGGPEWTSIAGLGSPKARFASADQSAADVAVTDAPTVGQKLVITDVIISVDAAMRVDLKEETSGTVLASFYLAANSVLQITPRGKWKLNTADKRLMVRTSAAGNISVLPFYYSET